MDEGERDFDRLRREAEEDEEEDEESVNEEDEYFSDGEDEFSTMSDPEAEGNDVEEASGPRAPDAEGQGGGAVPAVIGGFGGNAEQAPPAEPVSDDEEEEQELDLLPRPRSTSIAHHYIRQQKAVFISLDLEHGGEFVGIIQLSAEVFRVIYHDDGSYTSVREQVTFNEYVNPVVEASYWTEATTQSHGLHAGSRQILDADDLRTVWGRFVDFVDTNLDESETAVLTAYNGETCDLKWIWKLTQAPNAPLAMPPKVRFFLDPLRVIQEYRSCPLHPSKSQLESLELGVVWSYINRGENLNGAHRSLVDAKAQTDIVISDKFIKFIDKSKAIRYIDEIFSKKEQAEMKRKMEPLREVHQPWRELKQADDGDFAWEPSRADQYTGPSGGGVCGPLQWITGIASNATSLAVLFLALFPMTLLSYIAKMTHQYAYEDWVVEKERTDQSGNVKKKKYLAPCTADTDGARHRADNEQKKYTVTQGFVLAFLAILMIQGAHFRGYTKRGRKMWRKGPHGTPLAYVRNAMPRNAFEFMRRYLHFADNSKQKKKGNDGYDPLFKVSYVLKEIMKGLAKAWVAGMKITIDESMIKYKGRAICYVQFMPAKPIKHGVKVWMAACAESAVMLAFEIYVGSELSTRDNSALAVCKRLVEYAGLTGARGQVLFTDNWYTTMALAKYFFEKYGWTICGTITPTDKKSRQDHDIPFLKLSKGAVREVVRGWYREAVIEMKTPSNKKYYIQCTTWRDKKQVVFLHSHAVGTSKGNTVRRRTKGNAELQIGVPRSQQSYAENFHAVDRNDRDSSDFSITMKTVRYYLRMFCWMLDRVIHALYKIVLALAAAGINTATWARYGSDNEGRHDFQIDLGLSILNYAIEYDMKNLAAGERPDWMRQRGLVPCDCEACYFCRNGLTTGIAHKKPQKETVVYKCGKRLRSAKCSEDRVNLQLGYSDYCRMCYRKQDASLDYQTKKFNCNKSRCGCVQCKEPICAACWKEGYDRHQD